VTHLRRRTDRIATRVDVILATVLTRESATIIDISEGGAQVTGGVLAKGTRFMIEFGDDVVYGAVAWEEGDRMGVRFEHTLKAGPLYELAQRAKVLAGIEKSKQTARAVTMHSAVEMVGPLIRPGRRVFGKKSPDRQNMAENISGSPLEKAQRGQRSRAAVALRTKHSIFRKT